MPKMSWDQHMASLEESQEQKEMERRREEQQQEQARLQKKQQNIRMNQHSSAQAGKKFAANIGSWAVNADKLKNPGSYPGLSQKPPRTAGEKRQQELIKGGKKRK
jgi:hypothetical protein